MAQLGRQRPPWPTSPNCATRPLSPAPLTPVLSCLLSPDSRHRSMTRPVGKGRRDAENQPPCESFGNGGHGRMVSNALDEQAHVESAFVSEWDLVDRTRQATGARGDAGLPPQRAWLDGC